MPLLAYCITEASAIVPTPDVGVNGAPVKVVEACGLRCFVSPNVALTSAEPVRDAALTFHRVLAEIFQQAAIIPFRFPNAFPDESDVIAYMEEHSEEYGSALTRLRNMVQMEIRIRANNASELETKPSGAEYLRKIQARHALLEKMAHKLRETGARWIEGWRQRDSSDGIRCFALVNRAKVKNFQAELEKTPVQSDLVARLSGPWPATQFLKEE